MGITAEKRAEKFREKYSMTKQLLLTEQKELKRVGLERDQLEKRRSVVIKNNTELARLLKNTKERERHWKNKFNRAFKFVTTISMIINFIPNKFKTWKNSKI